MSPGRMIGTAKAITESVFVGSLEQATLPTPGRKKRDRTLARVRLATALCLEKHGYVDLRTSDISREAGLSEGSFYVYFEDKLQAAVSVLSEFVQRGLVPASGTRATSAFEAIKDTNRAWIANAIRHPGLIRALVQLVDTDADFAKTFTEHNVKWHQRVASSIMRRYPPAPDTHDTAILFSVTALNAMMDEVLRGVFVSGTYQHLLEMVGPDRSGQKLADALSVIWYRVLYPGAAIPIKDSKPYFLSDIDGTLAQLGDLKKISAT